MSNSLKMSDSTELVEVLQTTIYSLHDRGCSRRRIARELGIARETDSRYLRLAKPAISTTGLEGTGEAKPAISTAGNGVVRKSQCERLAEVIMAKVEVGLNAFTGFGGRERWLGAHQPTHTKRSSDKGSKNVGFHPLRAIFRVASENPTQSSNKEHRDIQAESSSFQSNQHETQHLPQFNGN
jgi:hypothetical protein